MPRYLTPAKLCLLILIDLYISDQIPADSRSDALSFIASHINTQSVNDRLQIQERLQTSTSDITVFAQTLSRWQSGVPGRTIYDILLHKVWCLNDLDSLHALFHEVDDLVAPATPESPEAAAAKISRASSLGQFIRRCCVEFTRPQFSDSQALWGSFSAYRASSFDHWASRNPDAARNLEAEQPAWAAASSSQYEADVATYSSADDTEHILSASIHHLQKLGTRVPAGLKSQLSHWLHDLQDSSAQSLQHFLAFFEHWRAAQYTMALESLHRYFDYSLVGKGAGEVGKESGMKMYYQYALLHLSVLHADFERWGESGDAMAECIATGKLTVPFPRWPCLANINLPLIHSFYHHLPMISSWCIITSIAKLVLILFHPTTAYTQLTPRLPHSSGEPRSSLSELCPLISNPPSPSPPPDHYRFVLQYLEANRWGQRLGPG